MPPKSKPPAAPTPERTSDASDAAVNEIADETTEQDQVTKFEYDGQKYTFKAKRLNAIQFRGEMQRGNDILAVEWLLGPAQYSLFLATSSDADGCTSRETFLDLLTAIGKASGIPNS